MDGGMRAASVALCGGKVCVIYQTDLSFLLSPPLPSVPPHAILSLYVLSSSSRRVKHVRTTSSISHFILFLFPFLFLPFHFPQRSLFVFPSLPFLPFLCRFVLPLIYTHTLTHAHVPSLIHLLLPSCSLSIFRINAKKHKYSSSRQPSRFL